jgi:hypothetical protein
VARKKAAPRKRARKAAPRKRVRTVKRMKQTGTSNRRYDRHVQAMPPGRRVSRTGRKYTERRRNRSDIGKYL